MDQEKFNYFCQCIDKALLKLVSGFQELNFSRENELENSGEKKLSAIVRVVGPNKGRVHIEMSENLAKKLFEFANGDPEEDEMDLCFYLAEFTNIVTGNGVTTINNTYKGSDFRLTPPAIFAGVNLDVSTPKVISSSIFYHSNYGNMRIEIGFEGV